MNKTLKISRTWHHTPMTQTLGGWGGRSERAEAELGLTAWFLLQNKHRNSKRKICKNKKIRNERLQEKGRVGGSYINLNLDLKSSFKGQFKKKVNYVTDSIKLHDTHYVLWKGIYYREPVLNGSEWAPRMNRLHCGVSSARLKCAGSVPSTPPTLPGKERQFTSNEDDAVTLPLSGAAYESREKHLWFWI